MRTPRLRPLRVVWPFFVLLGFVALGAAVALALPASPGSAPGAAPGSAAGSLDSDLITPMPAVALVPNEQAKYFRHTLADRVDMIADRYDAWNDDENAQFIALFYGKLDEKTREQHRVEFALSDEAGQVIAQATQPEVTSPKLPALVATQRLKPGRYTLVARLIGPGDVVVARVERSITRSDRTRPAPAFPEAGIPIRVHAQSHLPDAVWPISTGVPMPRLALRDVGELALLENGQPVPAQFSVRGTWAPRGSVSWVGIDFLARYDGDQPREYRLVRRAPAGHDRPLTVTQDEASITIDTGAIRFAMDRRRFTGLQGVWIDGKPIVTGEGGSHVIDQNGVRYEAGRDEQAVIELEDVGPTRATVAARGWYVSDAGEKFCQFVVRLTTHAGRPDLIVSHRTILTGTPVHGDERYITDAAFTLVAAGALKGQRFGADGATLTAPAAAEISLHQERSDRFRLLRDGETIGEGRRSDGWFAAQQEHAQIVATLRDVWQKFPAELAFTGNSMAVHFWPMHGRDVFSDDEELARDQIYKVRYAHEGKQLAMRIPDKYHDKLKAFQETEGWAGGAELVVVRKPDVTKTQMYDGMGVALSGELVLSFHARPRSDEQLLGFSRLVQQSPHAAADPVWNCGTGVLGPIAPRDPAKFGSAENLLDHAYDFYQRALVDGADAYGKWIYGAVHGDWQGDKHQASLVRVWQMCHYQNVFQSWLLYFRSGRPEHWQWASMHTNQNVDVSVINYMAYPPGTHSYSRIGDLGGGIYHCKGFVPWGGNASTSGHWIDLTNYFVRYQMAGDRRGLDLAALWLRTVNKMGNTKKTDWPSEASGFQDPEQMKKVEAWKKENPKVPVAQQPEWVRSESAKPAPFNPREELVPLGELVQFYRATWDPQVLIYLDTYAATLNTPFRLTNSPTLSHFGKHWQDWYYDLTHDPRVVQRVQEYMQEQAQIRRPPKFESFAAFLYHTTGDAQWIKAIIPDLVRGTLNMYDDPGDRYHQFCLAKGNPAAMILGRLPMALHAIDAAGLRFEASPADGSATPTRGGRVDGADKWLMPPRGWSNTGVTVLAWNPRDSRIIVSLDGPLGTNSFRGAYRLFYDWPKLDPAYKPAQYRPWIDAQTPNIIKFPNPNGFNDPPDLRNFSPGRGDDIWPLPYVEEPDHDPTRRFYRLEVGGSPIDLPAILDAQTRDPLPQVAVIARTLGSSTGEGKSAAFQVNSSCDLLMRPLRDDAVITIKLDAIAGRYASPTTLVVRDGQGRIAAQTSVFIGGRRTSDTITLDPARHPLPWRFTAVSYGDIRLNFEGAEELFFARTAEDFDTVLPKLTAP